MLVICPLHINFQGFQTHARDRVGRMEQDSDVQMNYCDIFGNADGFGLSVIIKGLLETQSTGRHILSDAMTSYYGNHYINRIHYYLKISNI